MISFRTLEHLGTDVLAETFNAAFADYAVPMVITTVGLQAKFDTLGFSPEYSVGAFEDDRLAGFIFHFYDDADGVKRLYNGGTGVLPAFRGQGLTQRMYAHCLTSFEKGGISLVELEVLDHNFPAIRSYENSGFFGTRKLLCFAGTISFPKVQTDVTVKVLPSFDWLLLQAFWTFRPTWQNAVRAVENLKKDAVSLGAYRGDELVGYVVFHTESKRIHQLAVVENHRRKGVGSRLLSELAGRYGNAMSVINVDEAAIDTIRFFESIGMRNNVTQLEMLRLIAH